MPDGEKADKSEKAKAQAVEMAFSADSIGANRLVVQSVRGVESLSQPYRYEIVVRAASDETLEDSEIETLLGETVYLAFGDALEDKTFGVIQSVDTLTVTASSDVDYRLVMVPRLAYLGYTTGTKIYQSQTATQIVAAVLRTHGLDGEDDLYAAYSYDGYPTRTFTMKYQESDLAFVSRLMESVGVWFTFSHEGDVEKLRISDSNAAFTALTGSETIEYDTAAGLSGDSEYVSKFERTRRLVPLALTLREYDYLNPAVVMDVNKDIAGDKGRVTTFGEGYSTLTEGSRVGTLRADLALQDKWTFRGRSNVKGLHPGHVFTLSSHPIADWDQRYVVTSIQHYYGTGESITSPLFGDTVSSTGYYNEFIAIPYTATFRPPRRTPTPRIYGMIPATIDGATDTADSPIDNYGRYKVCFKCDPDATTNAGGNASCWLRAMSVTSQNGYGAHLPLHKGTEVMIAFLDGDPDRPVIAGAVPNAATVSPVTSTNPSQGIIRTRNQIEIHFDDDA